MEAYFTFDELLMSKDIYKSFQDDMGKPIRGIRLYCSLYVYININL